MRRSLSLILALLLLGTAAFAAPPARNKEPIKIKSDTLHTDNDKRMATFEGKVVARQGDMTLYSDRLVITYAESGGKLNRVEAFGNVRIIQTNRQATGAHAVYEPDSGLIHLDGSPKVVQGNDTVTGKVITYYVNEERSVVTSGPNQRVEAVIHPGENNGKKP